jgi:type IV pilus assembly protein PilM
MPRTVIGLDVGTAAVRAAEIRFGRGTPSLVRFAQVALEPGVVVAGEVVDATAVAAAIKRLWREGGFKGKRVVTGVAGGRVVARAAEVPAMSEADLRTSLRFQVQELIPIPLEEAVIDHQVLESVTGDDGAERLRLLVVAVHQDVVRSLLAAISGAGLSVERIDLIPFALVRSLHAGGYSDLTEDLDGVGAEAIVDIGGGVTNVVVHQQGMPQFLRSLPTGGSEITASIATDLAVDYAEAEALKRRTDDAVQVREAAQVTTVATAPLFEDIRTTLDYWQSQTAEASLRRVVLTGGATLADEVPERLELALGALVVRGEPFAQVDASECGLSAVDLDTASTVAAAAVGLALSGESLGAGVRRISLVPREIEIRRQERQQVGIVAGSVAVFALLLLVLYALRSGAVTDAEREADTAQARTGTLQSQIAQLQDVELLQADIETRRQTVTTVLAGDVHWLRLLNEVSALLPNDVWLTSFQGTRNPTGGGTVTVSAQGLDQTSTAHWLVRLGDLASITSLWVPSSAKTQGAGTEIVEFSSNAILTPAAESDRASRYTGAGGTGR